MLRRNVTSAECQISDPKGRYLVFTPLFFQMPLKKTQDLNTKIITKKPGMPATAKVGLVGYTSSDIHPIDPRLNGLKSSHVLVADVRAFKASFA
jgi:hypothetical protein